MKKIRKQLCLFKQKVYISKINNFLLRSEKPKSTSLTVRESSSIMLSGFRSLCTMPFACKYTVPARIWNNVTLERLYVQQQMQNKKLNQKQYYCCKLTSSMRRKLSRWFHGRWNFEDSTMSWPRSCSNNFSCSTMMGAVKSVYFSKKTLWLTSIEWKHEKMVSF